VAKGLLLFGETSTLLITIIALKSCLLANEAVNGCLWQTLVVAKVGGGKGVFSGKRVADLLPFVLVAPLPHLCH